MTKETKSGEGKVSKRRSKDENAPKRARSAYMFFCQEKRKSIVEENPGVGFGEVGRLLGQEWRGLTEQEKQPYQEKANADKQRYQDEKEMQVQ